MEEETGVRAGESERVGSVPALSIGMLICSGPIGPQQTRQSLIGRAKHVPTQDGRVCLGCERFQLRQLWTRPCSFRKQESIAHHHPMVGMRRLLCPNRLGLEASAHPDLIDAEQGKIVGPRGAPAPSGVLEGFLQAHA